jgi:hypothetical protein
MLGPIGLNWAPHLRSPSWLYWPVTHTLPCYIDPNHGKINVFISFDVCMYMMYNHTWPDMYLTADGHTTFLQTFSIHLELFTIYYA